MAAIRASVGQRLAAIVPTDALYVEANYKEGQLADIAPGALVHIRIDALPGQDFELVATAAWFLIDFDKPNFALFRRFDWWGFGAMAAFLGSLRRNDVRLGACDVPGRTGGWRVVIES